VRGLRFADERVGTWLQRAGEHAPYAAVMLAPILWVFRSILHGGTYGETWWYSRDPLFAAARTFPAPARARDIWDPSAAALNAVSDRFASESWGRLELPLWDPYQSLGLPLLAELHAVVLSPMRLLLSYPFGGGDVGTTILIVAQVVMAAYGAFVWLRAAGISKEAAAGTAAAYPFFAGNLPYLRFTTTAGAALLPWMLWAVERLVREPSYRRAAALGALVGLAPYVTHPGVAGVCGATVAVYLFVRAIGSRRRAAVLAYGAIAGALAGSAAALLALPFAELMGVGWSYKQELAGGVPATAAIDGFFRPPLNAFTFVPSACLAVGCIGLLGRSRAKWACAILFALGLGLVFTVPWSGLVALVPYQQVLGRAYVALMFSAGAVGLCAEGIDLLTRHTPRRFLFVLVGAAIAVSFAIGNAPELPIGADWDRARTIAAPMALVGIALAAYLAGRHPLRSWALALAVWASLFVEIVPRASACVREEPRFDLPDTPAIEFLRSRVRAGERIHSTGTWASHFALTAHVPNVGLVTHFHDVRAAQAIFVARTRTLLNPISARSWYAMHFWTYPEPRRGDRPTILEMLGVRYVLARPDARAPADHERVYADDTIAIYENPRALARAYLVHDVAIAEDPTTARALVVRVDLRRTVVLEQPVPPIAPVGEVVPGEEVRIVRLEPQHVAIRARVRHDGYLVFTDVFYPGWEASIDGEAVETLAANVAVRAVRVTPGDHSIEFTYRPRSVRVGGAITSVSVLLMAAPIFVSAWRRRQRAASSKNI
jgi:hypothetical protein